MSIELHGNWQEGRAYDVHTLSSNYLGVDQHGHDQWENVRSEMGELVYQLKYQNDRSKVSVIVDLLADKFKDLESLDFMIPAPASKVRAAQPVNEITKALAERFSVGYIEALSKSATEELKGIDDPERRAEILKASMSLQPGVDLSGKNILIVDDLFRSGATLEVATEILYRDAKCHNVYVLTMTKTRSKR
jgi:competence protein ComFC